MSTVPFSASAVELAVLAVLNDKLPAYIELMGLPTWRSVVNENDFDRWRQDQLPSLIVVCPGLADTPRPLARSTNKFLCRWGVAVGMVVSASTEQATRTLAQTYAACIRNCVMHNRGLEGAARGTDWMDERYDAIEPDDGSQLSIAGGQVTFQIEFEVDMGYPPEGDPTPITSTELEVELIPLEGS
jgi:hypothetical protein